MTKNTLSSENHALDEVRLTAYALGQLDGTEAAAVEALLAQSPKARAFVNETTALAGQVLEAYAHGDSPAASPALRAAIEAELLAVDESAAQSAAADATESIKVQYVDKGRQKSWLRRHVWELAGWAACLLVLVGLMLPAKIASRSSRNLAHYNGVATEIEYPEAAPTLPRPDYFYDRRLDAEAAAAEKIKPPHELVPRTVDAWAPPNKSDRTGGKDAFTAKRDSNPSGIVGMTAPPIFAKDLDIPTEQYDPIVDNPFRTAVEQPLSTFSIDVDTAAYANMRRLLSEGRLPPPDAVRVEEFVNYFSYDYPQPQGDVPFAVATEVAGCPWQPEHRLVRIGLKGREIDRQQRGASNFVFLVDVSGSMDEPDKLPLVKQAIRMLVEQLGENDRVAVVTYASGTAVPLPSARGNERQRILSTIDNLRADGSTNGSAGIELAYEQATKHFVPNGVNRVILCTDGDLNVGITDDEQLVKLIEQKAKSNVFLTVLGFGTGNLKDSKMEKLADKGNGVYAYIDCLREARRVLVEQMTANLVTIAKDVKIQIEFNPAEVAAYRLVGYENRVMANRDFDNDKKDAGDIGAGHTVTALYEIVPADGARTSGGNRPLKYQRPTDKGLTELAKTGELLTLRLRYKLPEQNESRLLESAVKDSGTAFDAASVDFRFAAAVAAFGQSLRHSQYQGKMTLGDIAACAASAVGKDPFAHRAEFLDLVRKAEKLSPKK